MATSVTANFAFGAASVSSAGTAVQVESTARRVRSVMILAKDSNTGRIFYGGSDVASSTQRGLAGGESVSLTSDKPFSLATIYVDSSVSGEGVDWVATLG